MALDQYRQEDADLMKHVEAEFVKWLLPWRQKVNPMLVAIILVRCCRVVLRLCNRNDQKQLLPVLVSYLEGKTAPPKGEGGLIWTPDQGMPPGLM